MTDALIKGWCPGALRPMRSGDGLIARLRFSGGVVDIGLAAEIARWSREWGNGRIELTSRANLQLRGLSEPHLASLHEAMASFDLLDASAAGEAVRNVISSPLAGLDPRAVLDIGPIARALEQRLANDAALHDLPGKFGFAIDDGGAFGLGDVAADVHFLACHGASGPEFAIGLAAVPEIPRFLCRPDALTDVAAALGMAFLRLRQGRQAHFRRMRDLVAAFGAETITSEANLARFGRRPARGHEVCRGIPRYHSGTALSHLAKRPPAVILGLDPRISPNPYRAMMVAGTAAPAETEPEGDGGGEPRSAAVFVGAGLPYGRTTAEELSALASAATEVGARELRLTPWRAILVPVPSAGFARAMIARLPTSSFILETDDPRRRIVACPGAPSCARGTTSILAHAATLAKRLGARPSSEAIIHLSGCEKSCAHSGAAAVTLVARDGHYDLVIGGLASNPPTLRGLTPDLAVDHAARLVNAQTPRYPA